MSWVEKQYPIGCEIICPDGQVREVIGHFQDLPSTSMYERSQGVISGQRTEVPASELHEDGSSKIQK